MSDEPQRVRVTGPPRRRTPVPRTDLLDHDDTDRLSDIFLGSLMRAQLGLALRILSVLVVGLGSLPLLFWLLPSLADVDVMGIRIPWLLLGFLVYPFLLGLGVWFVRRAEQNEGHFAELLSRRTGLPDLHPDQEDDG